MGANKDVNVFASGSVRCGLKRRLSAPTGRRSGGSGYRRSRSLTLCGALFTAFVMAVAGSFPPGPSTTAYRSGLVSTARAGAVGAEITGNSLLDFVPAGVDLVLSVDFERALELPYVRKSMQDAQETDVAGLQERLDKYWISLENLCRKFVLFGETDTLNSDGGQFGFLVRTALEEEAFKGVLEAASEEGDVTYETKLIRERNVYLLKNFRDNATTGAHAVMPGAGMPENAAVVYLSPTMMLITGEPLIEDMIGTIEAGETLARRPMARLADVERESLLWGVYEGKVGPEMDIVGAIFSLNLQGPDQKAVQAYIALESATEEGAQGLFMQAQMISALTIPMLFEGHSQLGAKVLEAINIESSAKEVTLNIFLDPELIEALQEFAMEKERTE